MNKFNRRPFQSLATAAYRAQRQSAEQIILLPAADILAGKTPCAGSRRSIEELKPGFPVIEIDVDEFGIGISVRVAHASEMRQEALEGVVKACESVMVGVAERTRRRTMIEPQSVFQLEPDGVKDEMFAQFGEVTFKRGHVLITANPDSVLMQTSDIEVSKGSSGFERKYAAFFTDVLNEFVRQQAGR